MAEVLVQNMAYRATVYRTGVSVDPMDRSLLFLPRVVECFGLKKTLRVDLDNM